MQLTRYTDYSLRVLVYLGLHQERLVTISEVADYYRISENHLMKIVHQLALRGYIDTVRGKGGGMRLARRPALINIGDVVRDFEEGFPIAECFNPANEACPLLPGCTLKSILGAALKGFLASLDAYTLADLLKPRSVHHGAVIR
ncbi:MAG TPA: Rrf2 family transcriptional regulator [Gammaproteobacteria bacterium]|nr:Rrf2 family transcriptional regulator [Gammaproteobacteria bacterium]